MKRRSRRKPRLTGKTPSDRAVCDDTNYFKAQRRIDALIRQLKNAQTDGEARQIRADIERLTR